MSLTTPTGIWADVIVEVVDSHWGREGEVTNYMGGWVNNPIRESDITVSTAVSLQCNNILKYIDIHIVKEEKPLPLYSNIK